jgi:hypothetical protein
MTKLRSFLVVGLSGFLFAMATANTEEPVAAIKAFSDFRQIDLNRLLGGEVLAERGSLMSFPNGISVQTCFAVALSAEETAKRLQTWDPLPHRDLKVYAYRSLHKPCELADFQLLDLKSKDYPIRWFLERTAATTSTRSELNLTRDEASALAGCADKSLDPQRMSLCWSKLLLERASRFQQNGFAGVTPYEVGGNTVSPIAQLRTMLLEQLTVTHEFYPILRRIGLLGNETGPSLPAFHYWTFFDANHHGTLCLGATYVLPVDDHYQVVDLEYYVSGEYYTSVTLYELWPIHSGEKSGTLVWRGDYFAAPILGFTKGTERIAYGALMLQEIKKEIRYFQEDQKVKP